MWRGFRKLKRDECSRTRGLLSGYIDRRLEHDEQARVEEHLHTCQGCRRELESLRATVTLLQRLPEVAPHRSFAVVPVVPVLGHGVLRAMRFATVAVVVLLAVACTVDKTNVLEKKDDLGMSFGTGSESKWEAMAGDAYWTVDGLKNSVDPLTKTVDNTSVTLVVPDGSDNVVAAVTSLSQANDGVLFAVTAYGSDDVPQLALTEGEGEAAAAEAVEEYVVVTATDVEPSPFATNGDATRSALYSIMGGQSGPYLNMLSNDNSELYSFNLGDARKEVINPGEADWLRTLEYALIGLVVAMGGATLVLWFRQRSRKTRREAG